MRLLKDVPHPNFKIQIFNYNAKYIVKIELDRYEQIFKVDELEVNSLDDVERMITNELLVASFHRFIEMRKNWTESFNTLKK